MLIVEIAANETSITDKYVFQNDASYKDSVYKLLMIFFTISRLMSQEWGNNDITV